MINTMIISIQVGLGSCTVSIVSTAAVRTPWRLRFIFPIIIFINDRHDCHNFNIEHRIFDSVFNILAITINRYVMIAHPTLYPRWVLLLYDDSSDKADDEYTQGDDDDENNEHDHHHEPHYHHKGFTRWLPLHIAATCLDV